MRRLLAITALLAVAIPAAAASPRFPTSTLTIDTGARTVRLSVEVARTERQRQIGLMFRRTLAPKSGMVFLFDQTTSGPFWMKDTLIPLSIAFYDARGRIVRILDMTPCRHTPCRLYYPGVTYRGALEVNQGAFRRLHVGVGDVIRLNRT